MKSAPQLLLPFPEYPGVQAAFTDRWGGESEGAFADLNLSFRCGDDPVKVERNWTTVLAQAGLAAKTLILPRMVHGDAVAHDWADTASQSPPPGTKGVLSLVQPDGVDALYTRSSDAVLAVTMADCLAILVYDPVSHIVAAVHAGWRGTRLRILDKSLETLIRDEGLRPESTVLAFGPCLRPQFFEVGEDVAAQLDPKFLIRRDGRVFFDLPGCNHAQALEQGILPENIRDLGGCTLEEPDRYFSYRRDGQASGRQAALISLLT